MTRGTRVLLVVVLGGALLLVATVGVTAAAVYRAGSVAVEIEDDGHRFRLGLPAGLLNVAIALTPTAAFDEATEEIEAFLPALGAGWRELADAPDFVLVDVRSDGEQVRIEKSGDRIEVSVDAPDTHVRVGLPIGTVGWLLDKLDRHS
jgi:hypothetical protein